MMKKKSDYIKIEPEVCDDFIASRDLHLKKLQFFGFSINDLFIGASKHSGVRCESNKNVPNPTDNFKYQTVVTPTSVKGRMSLMTWMRFAKNKYFFSTFCPIPKEGIESVVTIDSVLKNNRLKQEKEQSMKEVFPRNFEPEQISIEVKNNIQQAGPKLIDNQEIVEVVVIHEQDSESEIDKAKRKILELTQFIKDEEAYIKNSRVRYNIRLNAEINDLLVDYAASVREETGEIIRLSRACERIIGIYLRSK